MFNYSIIIPHYNSFESLKRLLDSIPDRKDIEVIIINENNCKPCLYECEDSKVCFYNMDGLNGPGILRNIGLKKATGKWLLFADDDDYYLDGAFDILDDYIDADEDIVYFGFTSIYDDTKEEGHRHHFHMKRLNNFISKKDKDSEEFLKYRWAQVWSKLIKRELIESHKIKFDTVMISEDSIFSYKAAYFSKSITGDSREVYCLTRSKGSLTMRLDEGLFDIKLNSTLNVFRFLDKKIEKKYMPTATFKLLVYSRKYGIKKIFYVFCKIIEAGGNPFVGMAESLQVFIHDMKYRSKDKKYKVNCQNS